jgi:hypothetical protein
LFPRQVARRIRGRPDRKWDSSAAPVSLPLYGDWEKPDYLAVSLAIWRNDPICGRITARPRLLSVTESIALPPRSERRSDAQSPRIRSRRHPPAAGSIGTSPWQITRSSGMHMARRPYSPARKPAATMLPLFLSGWEMRSVGCDGRNGMHSRRGPALLRPGQRRNQARHSDRLPRQETDATADNHDV